MFPPLCSFSFFSFLVKQERMEMSASLRGRNVFSLRLPWLVFAGDKPGEECLCLRVDMERAPRLPCHSSLFIAEASVRVCSGVS